MMASAPMHGNVVTKRGRRRILVASQHEETANGPLACDRVMAVVLRSQVDSRRIFHMRKSNSKSSFCALAFRAL